ncbi:MAG: hypothetical protein AAF717_11525 [Bacteroidota bacterium]
MNTLKITVVCAISFLNCKNQNEEAKRQFLTEKIPDSVPIVFNNAILPDNTIIHKGIFSPDLKTYYYTVSDKDFTNFDIYYIRKLEREWSAPSTAFFNSVYDDHGMSFAPDGNTVYFSSTRPVPIRSMPQTWHIWKSDKVSGAWTTPVFVDIPNLRDKLVSHPIITNAGSLYFHSSNLDYSEMDIYCAKGVNNTFQKAEKVLIGLVPDVGKCTPYVAPDEDFLVFATIGNQLDLWVSFNDGQGNWTKTKRFSDKINTLGQGNPSITPDKKFLFFTTGAYQEKKWNVKWVNIESELQTN